MTWTKLLAAAIAIGTVSVASATPIDIIMDFDTDAAGNTIDAGQVIDNEYADWGVTIVTENLQRSYDYGIAFDSENPTGGDTDLRTGAGTPHNPMGNILVISERKWFNSDGNIAVPDDEGGRPGGYFDFFFDRDNTGGYVSLLDIEAAEAGTINLFDDGSLIATYDILGLGDSTFQTVTFNDNELFDHIRVNMGGSGSVTEVGAYGNVPEPASLGLLAVGSVMLLGRRRRERTS